VGRGCTPRDGLYGIADQLIDPGLGLHGPIGIPELSTFDLQLCMILTVSSSFFVPGLYKFLQEVVISILKIRPSSSSVFSVCKVTMWNLGGLV
jgi:hypothetical protein